MCQGVTILFGIAVTAEPPSLPSLPHRAQARASLDVCQGVTILFVIVLKCNRAQAHRHLRRPSMLTLGASCSLALLMSSPDVGLACVYSQRCARSNMNKFIACVELILFVLHMDRVRCFSNSRVG